MTTPPSPGMTGAGSSARTLSIRSVAIACALMPLLAMWVAQTEVIWYTAHSTAISLFFHVTFTILVLSLVNLGLQKFTPRAAFQAHEILTIYVMLCIGGALVSHDFMQILIPMLTWPTLVASPQNRWDQIILPFVQEWSIVTDRGQAAALASGNSTIYSLTTWAAWSKPLLFWGVFILAMMGALTAINLFFRQPWTEKERLAFPIIQVPLMIATDLKGLLTSKLFWIAAALVGFIDNWNHISQQMPAVPRIPVTNTFEFRDYLQTRPWDAIASTHINLYPFVIGLAFFLPLDLAFSCWFFFIVFKLQMVMTSAVGFQELPGAPYYNEQAAGAYMALGLIAIWVSRKHLRQAMRSVLGLAGGADESREPMSYRMALLMLIACFSVVVGCGVALGGGILTMLAFFLIFFLYSVAIARMRAELGPPAHDLHHVGPDILIHNAVGTRNLGEENTAVFSQFFFFNRAYRAHYSAHSIEGFKIAQMQGMKSRSMLVAMCIALVVGLLSGYWALMHSFHVHGFTHSPAGNAFAQEAWARMDSWVNFPQDPRIPNTVGAVVGLLFAIFLGAMRMSFAWWPLHPVGYATCSSWSMEKLWACIFVAWAAKLIITRYGGAPAYRKAIPFFVGLVLGEFVVNSLWTIWGVMTGTPVYQFWG